jgi:hypothetical protein
VKVEVEDIVFESRDRRRKAKSKNGEDPTDEGAEEKTSGGICM